VIDDTYINRVNWHKQ